MSIEMKSGTACAFCPHPFDDHQIVMPFLQVAQARQEFALLVGWVQCPYTDDDGGPCRCFATTSAVPKGLAGSGVSDQVGEMLRQMCREFRGVPE